jgi:hypothetical protein
MCTLHAVGISELSCNYLVNRPTRSFVRASRGQRSFLLGCRDVPQYKVMKYLVFGVTLFRVVFRYLAIAALSLSGPLDHGKTTLKITHHEVGWSPLRNHPITSEVDRFLTGKSPKCLRL